MCFGWLRLFGSSAPSASSSESHQPLLVPAAVDISLVTEVKGWTEASKRISEQVNRAITAYKEEVGLFFEWRVRRSRVEFIARVKSAITNKNADEMLIAILDFASKMHGPRIDAGCFSQTRLHNLLWKCDVYGLINQLLIRDGSKKECVSLLSKLSRGKVISEDHPEENLMDIIGYGFACNRSLVKFKFPTESASIASSPSP